jgi:hypothetical protein
VDAPTPNSAEKLWWRRPKGDAHGAVSSLCLFLRKHQKERRRANLLHQRIISNDDPAGRGSEYSKMQLAKRTLTGSGSTRSRYMLCLSVVDTAASIVSSSKPTLQEVPTLGDWELQRKAKRRNVALGGQMRTMGVERDGPKVFREGAVCDIASVYAYAVKEKQRDGSTRVKVRRELVPANEILIDHNEALHGDPRNRYRTYPASKTRLQELYPNKRASIESAPCVGSDDRDDFYLTTESAVDCVLVYAAWHLGANGKPGRFVLCTQNATLEDDEYDHEEFPFADFKYADMPMGPYGQSLVSRTKEAQLRINQLLAKYDRSLDLHSKCITLVPRSSGLAPEQMNNLPGTVLMVDEGRPELLTWSGQLIDIRTEVPAIREETLANEGLSEQQVQGERMQGVNSAVGLRAADDIQSRRHVHPQRRYEQWHLDYARLIARCNDDAVKLDPEYTVTSQMKSGRRDYLHSVKWADVQIDEDDARLQIFPTSSLSTTPKGRRDDVMGLLQAGMITQMAALELLDLPDIDAETANALAEIDYARWQVEEVMDGEDVVIDPILGESGLRLALDTARKAYLQCAPAKAPDEVMDRLRDYMAALEEKITALAPLPAPPAVDPAAMGVPPEMMPPQPGAPMPPMTATGGMA